jgi:hypothetical protein
MPIGFLRLVHTECGSAQTTPGMNVLWFKRDDALKGILSFRVLTNP